MTRRESDKPPRFSKNHSASVQEILDQALMFHVQGDSEKTGELFHEALVRVSATGSSDDLYALGTTALQMGDMEQAHTFLKQTLAADPDHAAACSSMGDVLFSLGQFADSIDYYRQCIALSPVSSNTSQAISVSQIHFNIGNAQFNLGRPTDALASYNAALSLNPDYADALYNSSIAHDHLGNETEAISCLEKVIRIVPDYAEAHNNLGNVYLTSGHLENAIECYEKALSIKPELADAHTNLGKAYGDTGRREEAVASYKAAIELNPDNALTYFNLGVVYEELQQPDKAVACYETAIRLDPAEVGACTNLGMIQREREHLSDAVETFENILRVQPDHFRAYDNLAFILQRLGRIDQAIDHHRKAVELRPAKPSAYNNLIYAMQFLPEITGEALLEESVKWDKRFSVPPNTVGYQNNPEPERRLRIGYVSADFRSHAVAYLLERLVAGHDRNQVEVFCYAEVINPDAVTDRFIGHADVWRPTVGVSDDDMAAMIRNDQIDIVVECSGRTASNRLLALSRKPAPLQVNFLALHGETSGMRCMDYALSDSFLTPPGSEPQFSEKLLLLDHGTFIFQPDETWPGVAPPRETDVAPVFACVGSPDRINDVTIELWGRLLEMVPGAQLLLKHPYFDDQKTRKLWRHRFDQLGDQVRFEGVEGGWDQHMDVYGRIDVVLDTYPMTGATSCLIPLWMGVPVLMLAAPFYGHRVGVSVLANAGQSAFVFEETDQYLKAAVGLVHDHDRLAVLRKELRHQIISAPICDAQSRIREIEIAYRDIWTEWCSG